MTTTTPTLTDRYILAVVRRLPAPQRPDVERELRGSIADAVDGRVEAGGDPVGAERDVLTELGDPDRLAASYADRPLQLIGPALFLDYVRLVKLLLAVSVPMTTAVVTVVSALDGDATVGGVIGKAIGTAATVAFHVVFWTTLMFAVIERTPYVRWSRIRRWTPELLPDVPTRGRSTAELIAATVAIVTFWTLVLLSPLLRFRTDADGDAVPLFSPWLWGTGVIYLFVALAVAGLTLDYVKHSVSWNAVVAVLTGLVGVVTGGLVAFVGAAHRDLNPAFVTAAGWSDGVATWVHRGLIIAGSLAIVVALVQTAVSLVTRSWQANDLGLMIRNAVRGLPGTPER